MPCDGSAPPLNHFVQKNHFEGALTMNPGDLVRLENLSAGDAIVTVLHRLNRPKCHGVQRDQSEAPYVLQAVPPEARLSTSYIIERCRRQTQPAFVLLEHAGIGNVATVATSCQHFLWASCFWPLRPMLKPCAVTGCMPVAASPMRGWEPRTCAPTS